MGDDVRFWQALENLLENHAIVVDRPKGSTHPRYPDVQYPLDYGYVDGTRSGDGEGIDIWTGTAREEGLTAVVCTVDLEKRDVELKLLFQCTAQETRQILQFHQQKNQAAILVPSSRM